MLKVLIDCNDHPAIFNLPHKVMEVGDYLCSAGFWNPYADLQLLRQYFSILPQPARCIVRHYCVQPDVLSIQHENRREETNKTQTVLLPQ